MQNKNLFIPNNILTLNFNRYTKMIHESISFEKKLMNNLFSLFIFKFSSFKNNKKLNLHNGNF